MCFNFWKNCALQCRASALPACTGVYTLLIYNTWFCAYALSEHFRASLLGFMPQPRRRHCTHLRHVISTLGHYMELMLKSLTLLSFLLSSLFPPFHIPYHNPPLLCQLCHIHLCPSAFNACWRQGLISLLLRFAP